jgi:hypothetical protein
LILRFRRILEPMRAIEFWVPSTYLIAISISRIAWDAPRAEARMRLTGFSADGVPGFSLITSK